MIYFHYRTLLAKPSQFQHLERYGDGHMFIQEVLEQAQAKLEQAQITTICAVDDNDPLLKCGQRAQEDECPLIVTWEFGQGRAMAFATDCSPHWAAYFQPWEYYGQFWRQAVRWLAKKL